LRLLRVVARSSRVAKVRPGHDTIRRKDPKCQGKRRQ